MCTRRAQFGRFAGRGAHGVAGALMAAAYGAGNALRRSRGSCRPWSGHEDARDGAWRSAAGRGGEGGGDAEAAQEGVEILLGVAVEGDRSPRARDDRGQGIAERGPARGQAGPVTARGEKPERGLASGAGRRRGSAGAAASPARLPAGRPVPRRAGRCPRRAGPPPRRPARSPRCRRPGAGPSRTAAAGESPRRTGTGPGAERPRHARRGAAGRRARGRGPTGRDGRGRTTGTRASPRRVRPRGDSASAHSSTGQSSPSHAPMISPGPHRPPGAYPCCTIPVRPPPRNPNARPARGATVSARARRRPCQGDSGRGCSGCRRTSCTATSKVTLTGNDARGRFHAQKERRPTSGVDPCSHMCVWL